MTKTDLQVSELHERLTNDVDGAVLSELLSRLTTKKNEITRQLDGGVSTAEYEHLSSLSRALDTGMTALPKLHNRLHQQNSEI